MVQNRVAFPPSVLPLWFLHPLYSLAVLVSTLCTPCSSCPSFRASSEQNGSAGIQVSMQIVRRCWALKPTHPPAHFLALKISSDHSHSLRRVTELKIQVLPRRFLLAFPGNPRFRSREQILHRTLIPCPAAFQHIQRGEDLSHHLGSAFF